METDVQMDIHDDTRRAASVRIPRSSDTAQHRRSCAGDQRRRLSHRTIYAHPTRYERGLTPSFSSEKHRVKTVGFSSVAKDFETQLFVWILRFCPASDENCLEL